MNIRKISQFFLIGGLAAFGFTSCTNLEVEETDSIVLEDAGGGFVPGDPAELLNSAYSDFGAYTDQNGIYALEEHPSDELIPPTRGVDWSDNGVWRTLHAHTWDPTHASILTAWNQLNERVFKCNQILASNPSPEQAAEAKFIRAFNMYLVMNYFGSVPFREVDEGVNVDPKVLSRTDAFNFVLQDLTDALPNLPNTGPAPTNPRATQAAANALLARLYLNKAVFTAANPEGPYTFDAADMTKVVEHCDAVTAAGYALEDDYFNNFKSTAASEVIFTSPSGTPQNRWMMTLHYNQNPSGWNGFTTLADFYSKFDADDQRIGNYPTPDGSEFSGIGRGFLVGQQYDDSGAEIVDERTQRPLQFTADVPLSGAATDKGIRVIKYHPADNGQYILLRYGDVVLMKAEAIMRGGSSSESALDVVNGLRAKRGAPALEVLDEGAMLDERGREMYWEGTRRSDQIRFGTFNKTWDEKTVTEAFRVLYPIPQQALDSNPNLQQNAGY